MNWRLAKPATAQLRVGNDGLSDLNWRSRVQTNSHSGLLEETVAETITQLQYIAAAGSLGGASLPAYGITYDGVELFAVAAFLPGSIRAFDPAVGGNPLRTILPSQGGGIAGIAHDGRDIWAVIDRDVIARLDPTPVKN